MHDSEESTTMRQGRTRFSDWGYRTPLRWLHRTDIKLLFEQVVSGWAKHNTPRLAAALAFYTLLSLMPLLLIVISIAGLVFGPHAAETGIMQQIQILIGAPRARILEALLEGARNRASGFVATGFGSITLLLGASGMLMELRNALNTIWDVTPRQLTASQEVTNVVKERLWSFGLVIAIGILLTASLLVNTGISAVGHLYASLRPSNEAVLDALNAIFSLAVVTCLFAAVYKIVPAVPIEWRDVIPGAAATSVLFTIGNIFLGLYLGKASFSSTYGAAASTVVLTLWVYYSSQILFLGAEFTKAFADRYGSKQGRTSSTLVADSAGSVPRRFHLPLLWPRPFGGR
jgi:membrane protein